MKREKYLYTTLRYVHDAATQEFFTVGVGMSVPATGFVQFQFRRNLGLAGEILDSGALTDFRALMRVVSSRAKQVSSARAGDVLGEEAAEFEEVLHSFLPRDDSALQWSPVSAGLTMDADATLERLYARYCGKYDRKKSKPRKTDRDAWQHFHRQLVDRRIAQFFSEKSIRGAVDEVKFPFAWKNGAWHCIEPVSFDLADADAIRNKAHRLVGEVASIRHAKEEFSVYYITTPPSSGDLADAFEVATRLLSDAPHDGIQVTPLGEEISLLDELSEKIRQHAEGKDDSLTLSEAS